jgi:hypothetical protein
MSLALFSTILRGGSAMASSSMRPKMQGPTPLAWVAVFLQLAALALDETQDCNAMCVFQRFGVVCKPLNSFGRHPCEGFFSNFHTADSSINLEAELTRKR